MLKPLGSPALMALWREELGFLWLCMSMGTITIANSPVSFPTWPQFPETKERGLNFRFFGYFFPQLWFYGLFHRISFPAIFCWYCVCMILYICLRTKNLKYVSWRDQLVYFFPAQIPSLPYMLRWQKCRKAPNSLFCGWLQNTSSIQRSKGQSPKWIYRDVNAR